MKEKRKKNSHNEFVDKLARALLKTLDKNGTKNEKKKEKQSSEHHGDIFV